jgi:hypothetical protein
MAPGAVHVEWNKAEGCLLNAARLPQDKASPIVVN